MEAKGRRRLAVLRERWAAGALDGDAMVELVDLLLEYGRDLENVLTHIAECKSCPACAALAARRIARRDA